MNNKHGFSLIELVVVLVIIGIMAAIAVPNIIAWLPNMRLKAAARDLYSAAMKAKGEAIKRNVNCSLVFNQSVGGVTPAYIVYADSNRNFKYDPPQPNGCTPGTSGCTIIDPIITKVQQWPKNVFLDTSQGGGDGLTFTNDNAGKPAIFFRSNSIPTQAGGGFANGTAFLKNTNNRKRSIVISRAGNISIQ